MNRSEIHADFVRRFGRAGESSAPDVTDLRAVENRMKIVFPDSYQSFLFRHGPVATPDILSLMVSAHESGGPDIDGFDVAQFLPPSEIVSTHELYVRGGMDSALVPIAADGAGNLFGFRKEEAQATCDDAAVWFFDHDFCELRLESPSFDVWLAHYFPLKA